MLIAAARPSASSWAMPILGSSDGQPPRSNSFKIDTARRTHLRPSGAGWEPNEDLHRPFRSIGTVPYHRAPWRRNSLGVVARSCARVRPIPFNRTALGSIRSTRPINSCLSPFQIHLGKEIASRFESASLPAFPRMLSIEEGIQTLRGWLGVGLARVLACGGMPWPRKRHTTRTWKTTSMVRETTFRTRRKSEGRCRDAKEAKKTDAKRCSWLLEEDAFEELCMQPVLVNWWGKQWWKCQEYSRIEREGGVSWTEAIASLLLFSAHVPFKGSIVISMFRMMHMTTGANTAIMHGATGTKRAKYTVSPSNLKLTLTNASCLRCMHCRNRVSASGIAEVVGIA